jgi:MFS family permease
MQSFSRTLTALVAGQVCLHSGMAGVRVAAPLLALRDHQPAWAVGLLLGLFAAAPVLLSLRAGRLADKHGYHRPLGIAVGLTVSGGALALLAVFLPLSVRFALLCAAATLCGIGMNTGLIAIQRSAGRLGHGSNAQVTRVFSWLGLAPALSNMLGPVVAGTMIDLAGFGGAFLVLSLMPLAGLIWARQVPREGKRPPKPRAADQTAFGLLTMPGFKRLLFVNWLMASSWDLHAFVVPILGHERGFSASAIGLILGAFAASVAGVRVFIPFLAERLRPSHVLTGAMLQAALVFAVYPSMERPGLMGVCACLLGIALGAVQPMVMTALHHLTPLERHGEAIALRSMAMNTSSALMPLMFGALGAAVGAGSLFWLMSVVVGAGSLQARRISVSEAKT